MNNFNIKEINKDYLKDKTIHFCGIGGIGMSAIARLMNKNGFKVQGSDKFDSELISIMKAEGIDARFPHNKEMIKNAGCLVYTSAVNLDKNEEIIEAKRLGIPVIHRSDALRIVAEKYKGILVSGAHGKTTSTSILGLVLDFCKKDPAIISGGIMNHYNANYRLGLGEYIVFEADESDGSFKDSYAEISLLTNIAKEHMEYYKTMENIEKLFSGAVERSKVSIVCIDDARLEKIGNDAKRAGKKIVTYGYNEKADFVTGKEAQYHDGYSIFEIIHNNERFEIKSKLYGEHNFQNLTGVFASALEAGCKKEDIIKAIANFSGVKRRFSQVGTMQNALIIDDYAVHPAEACALIKAAKKFCECTNKKGRLIGVFQPHRYSRAHELFEEFSLCFDGLDYLMICDIYAASEENIYGVDIKNFIENVKNKSKCKNVSQIDIDSVKKELLKLDLNENDVILFMGAGNITNYAKSSADILF